jgi:Na+/melibiose symporter-like transporter
MLTVYLMSFISGLRFGMFRRFSRPFSIYQYLLVAFSVVVLAMTLLLVNSLYERQQQQGKATLDVVSSFSSIIAADTFRMINDSREFLQYLAARPAIRQVNDTGCVSSKRWG